MVVSKFDGIGGHDVVISNLAKALVKLGHNVAIGSFSFLGEPPSNVSKISLKKFQGFDKSDYGIIHSHQTHMNYYSILSSKPFIFHYHGTSSTLQDWNLTLMLALRMKKIKKIIAVSNSAKNQIKNKLGSVPIDVIYNGVDTKLFNTNLERPHKKGDPQLLFVGKLYHYKNVVSLIRSIPRIKEKFPSLHLQIVGDGNEFNNLKKEVEQKKLENNVELVGRLSSDELRFRYSSCDVYLSASQKETFGVPLLEAMACGKPLLLSNIEAHKEILTASNAGLVFNDIAEIKDKLSKLYDNHQTFSTAARDFAQKHDWSIVAKKFEQIYNEILN